MMRFLTLKDLVLAYDAKAGLVRVFEYLVDVSLELGQLDFDLLRLDELEIDCEFGAKLRA